MTAELGQNRPPAGWTDPDSVGRRTFTIHGPGNATASPPDRPGYECFFVAVVGQAYTRWTYRPISHTLTAGCLDADDHGTDCAQLCEANPDECRHDHACWSPSHEETTCAACLDELAEALATEYAAAVERVRDRAQEARAGGRYILRHQLAPTGPRDLAEMVRRYRRDRLNWTAARNVLPPDAQ